VENFFNSPELEALRQAWNHADLIQAAADDAWWDSLTMGQRARAFRQICKLMYKTDVQHKGTYRYAIYDIFNIDYGDGLNHYMQLHNLISRAVDDEQGASVEPADDNLNGTSEQS
jgi:hypothetical protein